MTDDNAPAAEAPLAYNAPAFTFEQLAAWLKSRDPNEDYNEGNIHDCALARFLKDQAPDQFREAGFDLWITKDGQTVPMVPFTGYPNAYFTVLADAPHTMGAAADRAEAFLQKAREDAPATAATAAIEDDGA